jgi:hypothetical protein
MSRARNRRRATRVCRVPPRSSALDERHRLFAVSREDVLAFARIGGEVAQGGPRNETVSGTGATADRKRIPWRTRASIAGVAFFPDTHPSAFGRSVSTMIRTSGRWPAGRASAGNDTPQIHAAVIAAAAIRIRRDSRFVREPLRASSRRGEVIRSQAYGRLAEGHASVDFGTAEQPVRAASEGGAAKTCPPGQVSLAPITGIV